MYMSINLDAAVGHLKNLVDNIRCGVCDKIGGNRLRYECGHTSCQDCVVLAEKCSLCLTPPQATSKPVLDDPLTQRAANAVNLLNVFENEFHIDVYKRQRISEQLKAEKEVFPDCIQAPVKYCNKRKSFKCFGTNKENRLSQLPGEEISHINNHNMEKNEHVEMWLNRYVRKPFADLNSNDERLRKDAKVFKNKQNILIENTPVKKSAQKRSYFKSALSTVKNQTLIEDRPSPVKKTRNSHKKSSIVTLVKPDTSKHVTDLSITDHDESGMATDNMDVIVIDDTQSFKRVDKDYNAWLAVREAECNNIFSSSGNNTRSIQTTPPREKSVETDVKVTTKIPFYRIGPLSKQCNDCNCSDSIVFSNKFTEPAILNDTEQAKDVSITVNSKSFITTITIKRDQTMNKTKSKQSIGIQTDTNDAKLVSKEISIDKNKCAAKSQDIFYSDGKIIDDPEQVCMKTLNRTENVVIEETDSDDEIEPSRSLQVTAEIHRSCEEVDYGILADIDDLQEHSKRARRAARGLTPTSTDSSEKENFNPNRMKKTRTSKKKPNKK